MKYLSFLVILLSSTACVKTIPFNINDANKKLVIEGTINNVDSFATVKISETINLSDDITPPTVNGALVTITDLTTNKMAKLVESTSGIYRTDAIKGIPGHDYLLNVSVGDKNYTSTCQMPIQVLLDSIAFLDMSPFGLNGFHTLLSFQDPEYTKNYYRYVETVNGLTRKDIYIFDDKYLNGKYQSMELYRISVALNDSVNVEMQCIDKGIFDYFNQLANVDQNSGQQIVSPANPESNFSGGALGYFSAYTKQSKQRIVQ